MVFEKIKIIKRKLYSIKYSIWNNFYKPKTNPVFVFGNQKSGTSVISALLSKYALKSLTLDFDLTYRFEKSIHNVISKSIDLWSFIEKHKKEFSKDIIKEPNLTHLMHELIEEFPEAQFVFIVRHPMDNIRSILDRLNIDGRLKNIDTVKISSIWEHIINDFYLHDNQDINIIEKLALRWNRFVESFLLEKDKFILVRYEDFVLDKVKAIQGIADKLDLESHQDIKSYIHKQYQKKGKPNVNLKDFFGLENFSKIEQICGENMKQLGY